MRVKSLFVTILGVAIAGGSVYVARETMLTPSGPAVAMEEPQTVSIVVARTDVDFGVEIDRTMLTLQEWPRTSIPRGAFTSISQITSAEEDPRRTKTRLYTGEPILASKISAPGEKVTIVQKLGQNTRAVAISVNAQTAVGGFVTPGDHVDIVLTTSSGGDGLRAVTILQNVRIIGVDQQAEESNTQPDIARTVTVEVTPQQGQKLALAQKAGTLSLSLRTLDGVVDEPLDMVELRDLLQEKSPVEEAKEKKPQIIVRRGTQTEAVDIN